MGAEWALGVSPQLYSTHMQILIWKDGVQYNLTEEEVRQQLASRRLKPSDKASCEGARDRWIPLEEVLAFLASRTSQRLNESGRRETPPPPPQERPIGADHYAVLGVSRTASQAQIKAAYRMRMQEYHPDKVAHLGAELRALAERKAREINEAYEALCS